MIIQEALQFLFELKKNNSREWFTENKARYDLIKKNHELLIGKIIAEIVTFDEGLKYLTAKECLFRIYRDTRFSPDKTPYKTHIGAYMAPDGGRKSPKAGYYFHLEPGNSFVSIGIWQPEPLVLKELRQSVHDNIDEYKEITENPAFSSYYNILFDDGKLKTVPRGFDKDLPHAELLKLKHYSYAHLLTDGELKEKDFPAYIADKFKIAYPFNNFINYTIDELIK
ncbi:MAG: DUF2461 domain-containing protein [Prevotellaceae bacterium]|jgi:uncharacterized protein (TIGR02453 family)|nr:DUF2461 domain-containing protein [Prevotellaceae bacterium]